MPEKNTHNDATEVEIKFPVKPTGSMLEREDAIHEAMQKIRAKLMATQTPLPPAASPPPSGDDD